MNSVQNAYIHFMRICKFFINRNSIGGISPMAPERRKDLALLGLRAVLGGTLSTLLTATIAGILLG